MQFRVFLFVCLFKVYSGALPKCKVCVEVGFVNWWGYWYFTIAGLTTCKIFCHAISVNQAKVFLETLLCGAEEESYLCIFHPDLLAGEVCSLRSSSVLTQVDR